MRRSELVLPPFFSLLILAVMLPQLIALLIRDVTGRSVPMFIEPWLFLVLVFFASLGFAGMIFALVYAAALAYRRWASGRPRKRTPTKIWKPGESE